MTKAITAAFLCVLLAACSGGSGDPQSASYQNGSSSPPISAPDNPGTPEVPEIPDFVSAPDNVRWTIDLLPILPEPGYFVRAVLDTGDVLGVHEIRENELYVRPDEAYMFIASEDGIAKVTPQQFLLEYPLSINNSGQILGYGYNSSSEEATYFIYKDGTYTPVPKGSYILNNLGHTAGRVRIPLSSNTRAHQYIISFVYVNGVRTEIPLLPGAVNNEIHDMNDNGEVVGDTFDDTWTMSEPLNRRAYVYRNGTIEHLGRLPGTIPCSAEAINNRGTIIGYCHKWEPNEIKHFIHRDGRMHEIPGVPFGESIIGINDYDQVVGNYMPDAPYSRGSSAYIHSGGKTIDLNTLPGVADTGWRIYRVLGIKNSGMIIVEVYEDGIARRAVLRPVPTQ
jgi:hypothetical protein